MLYQADGSLIKILLSGNIVITGIVIVELYCTYKVILIGLNVTCLSHLV